MAELTAAIVLAAGKGTRIKSSIPKVLLPMNGRSLVGHANDAVVGAGAQHIVFVVRHEREQVAAHISQINPGATIVDQDDIKGTGRAAWCGLQGLPANLEGSVLIMAGDSPMFTADTLAELARVHRAGSNAVTVLSTVVEDATGYGRIMRDEAGGVIGIVEHKDATPEQLKIREIGTSTYVFDIAFLRESLDTLDTNNSQGEMYLTDVVARAHQLGAGVGSFVLEDSVQAEGVNDLVQLASLRAEKNRRIQEAWMRTGVHIVDPATTHVDVDVRLEPDSIVQPGTVLRGTTRVAAFAVVGPNTELDSVDVGERAVVAHAVVVGTKIAPGEVVSPFSTRNTNK
ncbi:UDP-N-acetylglucosamine diphosphorylase [Trueperella sp. HMSC08B05]|uniref:NTP transferase domain-containing protein n=1 Tax=Trueperella TaxID=1069494 RepID=UPI0008A3FC6E|nr:MULTISPECIES: NTP transferase domain-containing protein [Trueperella]MDV6238845.1 NTP transferase domain-containing protein [Trueperella bernardiae]OFS74969.1 UDP-N-acetylglucosamine diphosphorylase [Trueperella sp. HMSC08B05]WIM08139.1 NTP transferase domain-containing protein [Trueperella bernardiae]